MQESYNSPHPALILIDLNASHGSSNTKEATADVYSFIGWNREVTTLGEVASK